MAISPWPAGALSPAWQFTLQIPNSNPQLPPIPPSNFSLAVLTDFTLLFRNQFYGKSDPNAEVAGAGVFSVLDLVNAIVQYQPVAADVAAPGQYELILVWTPSAGPQSGKPYKWKTLLTITDS